MHSSQRAAAEVPPAADAAASGAADAPAAQGELDLSGQPPDAGRETR